MADASPASPAILAPRPLAVLFVLVAFATGCAGIASREPARLGGLNPYRVHGQRYVLLVDWQGYREEGLASWYGAAHHGRLTANGERFDAHAALTAAHRTLPFNVCARVENLANRETVLVRINDRGPFVADRVIDLSRAAAAEIGMVEAGVSRVRVAAVGVASVSGACRAP